MLFIWKFFQMPNLKIACQNNIEAFKKDLKEHQQGKSHDLTFYKIAAKFGVEKWTLQMQKMTCT